MMKMQNNDLISRSTAIAEIEEYLEEYSELEPETGYHNLKWCAMEEAKDALSMLPAVDATPVVHGRWEFCGDDYLVCGICGARYYKKWLLQSYCTGVGSDKMDGFWHCPHCGALLDGSEEDPD